MTPEDLPPDTPGSPKRTAWSATTSSAINEEWPEPEKAITPGDRRGPAGRTLNASWAGSDTLNALRAKVSPHLFSPPSRRLGLLLQPSAGRHVSPGQDQSLRGDLRGRHSPQGVMITPNKPSAIKGGLPSLFQVHTIRPKKDYSLPLFSFTPTNLTIGAPCAPAARVL